MTLFSSTIAIAAVDGSGRVGETHQLPMGFTHPTVYGLAQI